jgi:hypothetical protein
MKLQWNKGTEQPKKNGYYLAWNPYEDDYPVVLHFSNKIFGGWWAYTSHRCVVEAQVSSMYAQLFDEFFKVFEESASKEDLKVIKKMRSSFEKYIHKKYDDESFNISEVVDKTLKDESILCYDVGRPDYWAELPFLFDMDDDICQEVLRSNDPNALNIEVQDAKASAISAIVSTIEIAIDREMSRFFNPWEEKKAPWSKP